jgi:hypothetical protein
MCMMQLYRRVCTWCCRKGKYVNGADLQEKYVLGVGMQAEDCSHKAEKCIVDLKKDRHLC